METYKVTVLAGLTLLLFVICRYDQEARSEQLLADPAILQRYAQAQRSQQQPQLGSSQSPGFQADQQNNQITRLAKPASNHYQASYVPKRTHIYFYPKMGKCGSTTMHKVLKQLSETNNFDILHIEADGIAENSDDLDSDDTLAKSIISYVQNEESNGAGKNLVIVKHHKTVNFTKFNMDVNSFNFVRHPVSRWVSAYNFCRGGMSRKPMVQQACQGFSQEFISMKLEDSVRADPWVTERYKPYFLWLEEDDCHFSDFDEQNWVSYPKVLQMKQATTECIKSKISRLYVTIGTLEEYDLSMLVFEKYMPEVFTGALGVLHGRGTSNAIRNSKTVRQDGVSNETFNYLSSQPFKFEVDLYEFIVARLHQQAKMAGLES